MKWSTNPSKNVFKNLNNNKIYDKAVQSNILWLNLNKINNVSILQSADKQLQFASLHDRQVFVWSNCLLDLGTGFLVGNIVFV